MNLPRLSNKEYLILQMLIANGEMYGLELVKTSAGKLKRGTVYVTLERMTDKGFVESERTHDEDVAGPPRRVYRATGTGARTLAAVNLALNAFAEGLAGG